MSFFASAPIMHILEVSSRRRAEQGPKGRYEARRRLVTYRVSHVADAFPVRQMFQRGNHPIRTRHLPKDIRASEAKRRSIVL